MACEVIGEGYQRGLSSKLQEAASVAGSGFRRSCSALDIPEKLLCPSSSLLAALGWHYCYSFDD